MPSMKRLSRYSLLILVPLSIVLDLIHFNPLIISIVAVLAIIPVTMLMARSTQDLSARAGPVVGSLMNFTFGNVFELAIAIFALRAGLVDMVKASLVGSIIQNILLVIGLSMLAGGFKYREQTFNKDSVSVASTMLLIAISGFIMPTLYSALTGKPSLVISQAVSIALLATYLLSLVFSLFTHRHLFETKRAIEEQDGWPTRKAVLILVLSVALAALESYILVNALEPVILSTGISQAFIGLVVIAIIGNIPEISTAIGFAVRDRITQSLEIGMNSAIQIALFVVPILIFLSPLLGGQFTLAFAPFQVVGVMLAVLIINYIGSDGVCNWLEGVQLASVYAIIAIAFYFI